VKVNRVTVCYGTDTRRLTIDRIFDCDFDCAFVLQRPGARRTARSFTRSRAARGTPASLRAPPGRDPPDPSDPRPPWPPPVLPPPPAWGPGQRRPALLRRPTSSTASSTGPQSSLSGQNDETANCDLCGQWTTNGAVAAFGSRDERPTLTVNVPFTAAHAWLPTSHTDRSRAVNVNATWTF
jgi:hypothetical protein